MLVTPPLTLKNRKMNNEKITKGCVVYMSSKSGCVGYGNPQCVSSVCEPLGEISLYGHNQHYKIYDVREIIEYPESTPPEGKGYSEVISFLESLKENLPYPEDIFLPVSKRELSDIHDMLKQEFGMPLDRLTGHIGRLLRNPLSEQAQRLIASLLPLPPVKDDWDV